MTGLVRSRVAEAALAVASFYRRPVAWAGLFVSGVLLTFGGGAVMFWFHAVLRGEQGPAIGDLHHWLLDSSLGFVALTPVLAVILPFGVWAAGRRTTTDRLGRRAYVVVVASVFTLTTGPGPFLHNAIAGAGTPLAGIATDVFGENRSVAARNMHAHDRSPLAEGFLQVVVGFPVYLVCTAAALAAVRALVRHTRRRRAAPMLATVASPLPQPTNQHHRERTDEWSVTRSSTGTASPSRRTG